ncbi:MAG: GntR family transcriptional regulator [Pseudomonadota bacterium]
MRPLEDLKAGAAQVADILRDRIIKGKIKAGGRLVERHLSAELNVSRTPIREALKLLEADGLIEISMHRGAIVSDYRPEDAFALFDVIAVLESLAAKRVCEIMTASLLQQLEDMHGDMLAHHAAGRRNAYFDLNTVIHDFIIRHAANPVLATTHERLMIRARRGRFLAIMNPDRLSQAVSEHETLMQMFRDGDVGQAATVWERHLRHTGETVAAALRDSE